MALLRQLAIAALPFVPRPLLRKVASRYVAGERLEDALERLRALQGQGFDGIVDLLGEEVADERAAREVVSAYQLAADEIHAAGFSAYVSVKPTHLGLTIDETLALEGYRTLAAHCRELGLFVRVEMEDRHTTSATLRVFATLHQEFDNVGIVLQSRLFRTPDDVEALPSGDLSVRLVKGIYLEPPEAAHTDPEPIRDAYEAICRQLFERGASIGLATHDADLAERCLRLVRELDVPRERYEFQVLLGVQPALWTRWRDCGHRVRVYVPYGPDWRAYSLRRLRKNPQIFGHVMRDFLGLK